MKNLLKLGKALNKAEQKEVFGGTIPRDECDPGSANFIGLEEPQCICWLNGGDWNEECEICRTNPLPGFYENACS